MFSGTAQFLDLRIKRSITPGKNWDVYTPRLTDQANFPDYKKIPHHIYFYYLSFLKEGYPDIRLYEREFAAPGLAYDDVPTILNEMATNARRRGQDPRPSPCDFSNLKWKRISYVAFVIDSDYWQLWRRISDPAKAGIVFNPNKGHLRHLRTMMKSCNNDSFFDAADVAVSIENDDGGYDSRSGIYFVNHMKDANDKPLGSDPAVTSEYFNFELYCDVRAGGGLLPMVFVIDPGGTNMGPAQTPP